MFVVCTDQRELFESGTVVVVDHGGEVEHPFRSNAVVGEVEYLQLGEEEALVAEAGKQVENAFGSNVVV